MRDKLYNIIWKKIGAFVQTMEKEKKYNSLKGAFHNDITSDLTNAILADGWVKKDMLDLVTKLPGGAKQYIKIPVPIKAVKMKKDFKITVEGELVSGEKGDYLVDISGSLSAISKSAFEKEYKIYNAKE